MGSTTIRICDVCLDKHPGSMKNWQRAEHLRLGLELCSAHIQIINKNMSLAIGQETFNKLVPYQSLKEV